jgi:5S rRNA maturation endonuclease (ribonuclease M5)
MTNTLNNTANSAHRHKLRTFQEWGEWDEVDGFLIRNRQRWSSCIDCSYKNELKILEKQSTGHNNMKVHPKHFLSNIETTVAQTILKELYVSNNSKRWSSWEESLNKIWEYTLVSTTIEKLHTHSYVIKHHRKNKERINSWELSGISYNNNYIDMVEDFLNVKTKEKHAWEETPFPSIASPLSTKGRLLYDLILTNKALYLHEDKNLLIGLDQETIIFQLQSISLYYKMVRALYGLYLLTLEGRRLYLKTFSQEFFGDTKVFTRQDREKLNKLVGETEKFGLLPSRDEILLYGDFKWKLNGFIGHSLSFKDYIPIPRDMIAKIALENWNGKRLLIVENQDLFISLAKGHFLHNGDWSILLGSGYMSSEELAIIKQTIPLGLKEVYIWCDLDPYGYMIAKDFIKKFNANVPVYLFGFNQKWFTKLSIYKELTSEDNNELSRLLKQTLPGEIKDTLSLMKDTGFKGEQEYFANLINQNSFEQHLLSDRIELQ